MQEGTRLEQSSEHVDLEGPGIRPFRALGGQHASPGCCVARHEVGDDPGERLVGTDDRPEIVRPDHDDRSAIYYPGV